MILTPSLKLPKNGEDWGKLIVAKGFKKLPEIQNIGQSGHTVSYATLSTFIAIFSTYIADPIRAIVLFQSTTKCIISNRNLIETLR